MSNKLLNQQSESVPSLILSLTPSTRQDKIFIVLSVLVILFSYPLFKWIFIPRSLVMLEKPLKNYNSDIPADEIKGISYVNFLGPSIISLIITSIIIYLIIVLVTYFPNDLNILGSIIIIFTLIFIIFPILENVFINLIYKNKIVVLKKDLPWQLDKDFPLSEIIASYDSISIINHHMSFAGKSIGALVVSFLLLWPLSIIAISFTQ